MIRNVMWSMTAALSLAAAAPGFGQAVGASGQARGQSSGQAEMQAPPADAAPLRHDGSGAVVLLALAASAKLRELRDRGRPDMPHRAPGLPTPA